MQILHKSIWLCILASLPLICLANQIFEINRYENQILQRISRSLGILKLFTCSQSPAYDAAWTESTYFNN